MNDIIAAASPEDRRPLAETATSAAAAQARAMVEARYIMAMRNPRNMDMVRTRILKECDRPAFADVAEYAVPRAGTQIVGPSIRFAEAALRALGNVLPEVQTIFDNPEKRIVRVSVTDLEVNLTYTRDVTIAKTMERKTLRRGQTAISSRTNSAGETVHTVEVTEDELLVREGAHVSKAMRTLALRLLPGDMIDEAIDRCHATLARKDKEDPETARRKLLDAFTGVGVTPADLATYLGHDTSTISPNERQALRAIFTALKDGTTTWAEIMSDRDEAPASETTESKSAAADAPQGRSALLREVSDLRLKVGIDGWKTASMEFDADPKTNWHQQATDADLTKLVTTLRAMLTPATKAAPAEEKGGAQ